MKRHPALGLFCLFALLAVLVPAGAARADLQPVGQPLPITADPDGAALPAVASDPLGNFTVAWFGQLEQGSGLRVRRFDASGRPLGPEIQATPAIPWVGQPRIAADPAGGMVVVWAESLQGTIRALRLAADGQPVGQVIEVSTPDYRSYDSPDITFLQSGGFVVVWHAYTYYPFFQPIPGNDTLFARLFDATGEPRGYELLVGVPLGGQSQPRVAADPAGGFAVAWEDAAGDFSLGSPLEVSRFAADGTPRGPDVRVTSDPGAVSPIPLFAPGGELSVVWADLESGQSFDSPGLYAQRIAGDGSLLGAKIRLADDRLLVRSAPDAVADRLGHRLLVWAVPGAAAGSQAEIRAGLFDAAWQPLQPTLTVGRVTPRHVAGITQAFPPLPVAAAGAAGFLAVWDEMRAPADQVPQVTGQLLTGACLAGSTELCLGGDRFHLAVAWRDPRSGATGTATARPLTGDTGAFWFFSAGNAELLVKVLDGRAVNDHWWVFFGALTDLEYDLTVTDTRTGARQVYHNPPYTLASRADINAFADPVNTAPPPSSVLRQRAAAAPCPAGACLGAFQVSVEWTDAATGKKHQAAGVPLSGDSAYFWFFAAGNIELVVKVLDGHAVNGHWWVFYGGLTNVEYTLTVDSPGQHLSRSYHNPKGHMESRADTQAFP